MAPAATDAATDARAGARHRHRHRRKAVLAAAMFALLLAAAALDVAIGPGSFALGDVIAALWAPDSVPRRLAVIVWDVRLPTALMAALIGAMLGIAGALMQTILRNPLADPFTLGISAAAGFGAALAIALGVGLWPASGPVFVTANAFLFALATSSLLFAFTRLRGVTAETMILVGIALLFTFNALLALVQYRASESQLQQIVFWMMGSLGGATWPRLGVCAVLLALALPYVLWRGWMLTALTLGDDRAANLGVPVARLRLEMLAVISLLAATAVSFVGTIGFVGLVGPHIARLLVGEDQRHFLPVSAAASATLLSLASTASKAVTPGIIYPIGIITSLIGVPFFLALVLSIRKESWR